MTKLNQAKSAKRFNEKPASNGGLIFAPGRLTNNLTYT